MQVGLRVLPLAIYSSVSRRCSKRLFHDVDSTCETFSTDILLHAFFFLMISGGHAMLVRVVNALLLVALSVEVALI